MSNMKTVLSVLVAMLMLSGITMAYPNIGVAVTDAATTLQEVVKTIVVTISNPVEGTKYGGGTTDVNVAATVEATGTTADTYTYSLDGNTPVTVTDISSIVIPVTDNGLVDGGQTHNIKVSASNSIDGTIGYDEVNVIVDTTAPAQVTNVSHEVLSTTSIKWTWTNPSNTDFNGTIININGGADVVLPKEVSEYTATDLTPGTEYTISIRTQDNAP